MKLAQLFTVPTGEKVTEKAFLRVLISSICSMLLCMGCLFGTTWAWFTVEINNSENEIQIAKIEFEELTLTKEGNEFLKNANTGAYDLTVGTYSLKMTVTNDAAAPKRSVYVVMTLRMDQTVKSYYFPLLTGEGTVEQENLLEIAGGKATLSFALSWVIPAAASTIPDETIQVGVAEPVKQENAPAKEQEETETKEEKPQSTTETTPPTSTSAAHETTPPVTTSTANETTPPVTTVPSSSVPTSSTSSAETPSQTSAPAPVVSQSTEETNS